jgi:hypothetical protein
MTTSWRILRKSMGVKRKLCPLPPTGRGGACPARAPFKPAAGARRTPRRIVIPSVAKNLLFAPGDGHAANYSDGFGGSAGTVEGFGGVAGFGVLAGLVEDVALPTVRYLRIFSSRFGPMPRMALRSSTLLNAPYDLRICKIFSAVTGPIPGTNCSSSDVAVFKLTGAAGGFFLAGKVVAMERITATRRPMRNTDRHAMVPRIMHEQ